MVAPEAEANQLEANGFQSSDLESDSTSPSNPAGSRRSRDHRLGDSGSRSYVRLLNICLTSRIISSCPLSRGPSPELVATPIHRPSVLQDSQIAAARASYFRVPCMTGWLHGLILQRFEAILRRSFLSGPPNRGARFKPEEAGIAGHWPPDVSWFSTSPAAKNALR